jgi:hypothetical protein
MPVRHALRRHPASQVPPCVADRFVDREQIGDQRLVCRAAAEVRGDRIDDVLRVLPRHSRKTREPVVTHAVNRRCVATRRRAHPFERLPHRRELRTAFVRSRVHRFRCCRSCNHSRVLCSGGRRYNGDDTLRAAQRRSSC